MVASLNTTASLASDFWHDQLVAHERQALFLVLVAFLGSFGFIRLSARLGRSPRFPWWPGSVVSDSGVHLHHLVWGICLMLAAGTAGFAMFGSSPGLEICAAAFGIGAGLTIDEFALWIYLEDVYWSREGRASIDAAVLAAAAMLLVLLGGRPFEPAERGSGLPLELVAGAIVIGLAVTCLAKQRLLHCTLGCFVWPLALYGAARIAKPGSAWARRFYGTRSPRKQAKAEKRFPPDRRTERFKERFRDAVGGEPDEIYRARLEQTAAVQNAASQIRERADRAR